MNFIELTVKYRSKIIIKSHCLDVKWAVKQEVLPRLRLIFVIASLFCHRERSVAISPFCHREERGDLAFQR